MSTISEVPTIEADLLARAEALLPMLREGTGEAERLRRIPDPIIAALKEAGLFRILQPRRAGGYELPYRALVDFTALLAQACGATAWVYTNVAAHAWMLGMWPAAAQDEVWGRDPDTLIASALIFRGGRAKRAPGGYRVTGRWPFSSGVDPSSWNMIGAIVEEADEEPHPRMFLMPAGDYAVIDTWYVAGLAGTGSQDVEVKDVFVPEHRTLAAADASGGPSPGSAVNPSALYRLPQRSIVSYSVAAVALGIAQGTIAQFTEATRNRVSAYTGRSLADFATLQHHLAEASAYCDAAQALLLGNCEEVMALTEGDTLPSLEQRARYRRDGAFAARLATQAVDVLFAATGGAAIYLRNPIQRAFRDVHAASAHFGLNWDVNGAIFGRVMLGLAPDGPL